MKTLFIVIAVLAVVVLIVVFRKQIGAFFSPNDRADGAPCTDANGNASTYLNGVCKEVSLPGPEQEVTERIIIQQSIPSRISIRRFTRNCLTTIRVPQYPGIVWRLIGSNRFFCYYGR